MNVFIVATAQPYVRLQKTGSCSRERVSGPYRWDLKINLPPMLTPGYVTTVVNVAKPVPVTQIRVN